MPIDSRIPLSIQQARPFDAFDKGAQSKERSRLSDLQAKRSETTDRLNELKIKGLEDSAGKPTPWNAQQLKVAREMASRLLATYETYKDQPDAQQQWEQDAQGATQMMNGFGIDTSALPALTPDNVASFAEQVDQSFSDKPITALGPEGKPGLFQLNPAGQSRRLEGLSPIPKAGGGAGSSMKTVKGDWPVSKIISIWKSETNQTGSIDPAAMIRAVRGEAPEANSKAASFLDWWNGSDLNPDASKSRQKSAAEAAAEAQGLILLP